MLDLSNCDYPRSGEFIGRASVTFLQSENTGLSLARAFEIAIDTMQQ